MKKLIWMLLLLAATSMWAQTQYNPGTTATSLNAVSTTGAGTTFNLLNQSSIPAYFTWSVVVNGGTASAITTILQGCMDAACTTTYTLDTSTSTSGETRSVANKPVPYVRCDITSYTTNGTTATCKFVAMYGAGIPAPTGLNQCFTSQGTFQGAWTWAACSGAGGTVTASGSPVAQDVAVFSSPSAITGTTGLTWDGTTLTNNLGTGGNIQTESYFGDFYDVGPTGGKWIWLEATSGGFHVALPPATLTGTHTATFPDGDSNTVQPLTSGTTHEWVSYINSAGTQNLTQPSVGDLTSGALANGTTATTQAASSNDTKVATDAFVIAQIAAGGATLSAANTLTGLPAGCVQFPCVVATKILLAQTTVDGASNTYTLYTVPTGGAGVYRISGGLAARTQSSTSWVVDANHTPPSGTNITAATCVGLNMNTKAVSPNPLNLSAKLNDGDVWTVGTITASGSNTGGNFDVSWVLERLQ